MFRCQFRPCKSGCRVSQDSVSGIVRHGQDVEPQLQRSEPRVIFSSVSRHAVFDRVFGPVLCTGEWSGEQPQGRTACAASSAIGVESAGGVIKKKHPSHVRPLERRVGRIEVQVSILNVTLPRIGADVGFSLDVCNGSPSPSRSARPGSPSSSAGSPTVSDANDLHRRNGAARDRLTDRRPCNRPRPAARRPRVFSPGFRTG